MTKKHLSEAQEHALDRDGDGHAGGSLPHTAAAAIEAQEAYEYLDEHKAAEPLAEVTVEEPFTPPEDIGLEVAPDDLPDEPGEVHVGGFEHLSIPQNLDAEAEAAAARAHSEGVYAEQTST